MSSGATTPRSRSRAKRSTTNLSNLRLAPLSSKFSEQQQSHQQADRNVPKSPYTEDITYTRSHSSYIQDRSTPSTPGVLSRSSSRKRLSGGLSRTDLQYYDNNDDDSSTPTFTYAPIRASRTTDDPDHLTKAKSEAYLNHNPHHTHPRGSMTPGPRAHTPGVHRVSTFGGPLTAIVPQTPGGTRHSASRSIDATWLAHTSATTSALLLESKGQSWLSSRATTAAIDAAYSSDEDENYEEMAASGAVGKSHSHPRGHTRPTMGGGADSPTSTRVSRWGSRYGSRAGSRRQSRVGSPTGMRTPRRSIEVASSAGGMAGYFDAAFTGTGKGAGSLAGSTVGEGEMEQAAFVERSAETDDELADQAEVARLTEGGTFGLGEVVDRVMSFRLFDRGGDETDDEVGGRREGKVGKGETVALAKERMRAEAVERKKKEGSKAVPVPEVEGKKEGYGWSDAAWLLSVAGKALF